MGTFQITYDDFTGGHYMGDRSTELPKNTWKGTNAILSPRGDLVPSGCKHVATVTKPTATVGHPWEAAKIWSAFQIDVTDSLFFVTWYDTTGPTYYFKSEIVLVNTEGPTYGTTRYSLTGRLDGYAVWDNYRTGTSVDYRFTYLDGNTGDVRQFNWTTKTDSLVVANPFGTLYPYYLFKVGSRLVTYKDRKLFYSGALDAATWSTTTQYYEFPDDIVNIYPRTNDFLVATPSGLYSVTGVLGESVNIQTLIPDSNIYPGFSRGCIDNRTVYIPDDGYSVPSYPDGSIYVLNGSVVTPIATLDQSDLTPIVVPQRRSTEHYELGIGGGNQITCWARSGVAWFRNQNGSWSRFFPSNMPAVTMRPDYADQQIICKSVANFSGDTTLYPVDEYTAVGFLDSELTLYVIRYINNHLWPNSNDFSWDLVTSTAAAPASATVDLSEYWHSKPMVVREVIIEAGFDTDDSLNITGNATIQPFVKPTGIIDKGPNDTGSYVSSTQTITVDLSTINANNSNAMYRFKINDAGRAYGFFPRITWQGCRIRRVICICED
jgi:hypothetical protein